MKTYHVVWEMSINAKSELDAAKKADEWLKDKESAWQYYVQDSKTQSVVSVDLSEPEEDMILPVEKYEPLIENK